MANQTVITITHGTESVQTIKDQLLKAVSAQREEARSVADFLLAASAGNRSMSMDVQVNGGASVAASGTIIFSGVSTANDTIIINGVTLTAVASGATNNQFNVKASAALQSAEVARAINASSTALVSAQVVAAGPTATCTISALNKGVTGNAITIAKGTDAGSVMTVSGARLTGGVAISANVYHLGV